MKALKRETLSIRTTKEIKELLQLIAMNERRSLSSMIEVLVLKYAEIQQLKLLSSDIKK